VWGCYEQKCTLKGHSKAVTSVAYSPDGKHIVSGSGDHAIRIWDAATGKKVSLARSLSVAAQELLTCVGGYEQDRLLSVHRR
jgi:WD40 repeat protein